MNPKKNILITFFLVFFLANAYSAPLDEFGFQGELADSLGNPIDTNVDIQVRVYDVLTGGTHLWQEDNTDVNVSNGIFSISLGDINTITDFLDFNAQYYLELFIDDDSAMTPRVTWYSVPYAYYSQRASDFNVTSKLDVTGISTLNGIFNKPPTPDDVTTGNGTAGTKAVDSDGGTGGKVTIASGGATPTGGTGGETRFDGGTGGEAISDSGTARGGQGGQGVWNGGQGGVASSTSGSVIGGNGGQIVNKAGRGASITSTGSGSNNGGQGGDASLTAGNGGTASGSSLSNIGGNGGDITFSAGRAGTASGTNPTDGSAGNHIWIAGLGATVMQIIGDTLFMGLNVTDPDAMIEIATRAVDIVGLHIKASVGQTANLFIITDSSDLNLFIVNEKGDTNITGELSIGGSANFIVPLTDGNLATDFNATFNITSDSNNTSRLNSVTIADLNETHYSQLDANAVFITETDSNLLYVLINPTSNQSINSNNADVDFIVNGTGANTLVVDAGNNRLGHRTGSPSSDFHMVSPTSIYEMRLVNSTATSFIQANGTVMKLFGGAGAVPAIEASSSWANNPSVVDIKPGGVASLAEFGFGLRVLMGSGTTQNNTGLEVTNAHTSTGNNLQLGATNANPEGNSGFNTFIRGVTTGLNIGGYSEALNGILNIGLLGKAVGDKATGTNIGIMGIAYNDDSNAPIHIGGYFGMDSATPTFESSALIADNDNETTPIFLARDDGTTVFSITDGGDTNLLGEAFFGSNDGNYAHFDTNGLLHLHGNARATKELTFRATNSAKGSSAPSDVLRSAGASGTLKESLLSFSKTTQQDTFGAFHPPSDLDEDKNVEFHLMWIPGESYTTGDYKWCLEFLLKYEHAVDGDANIDLGTPTTICESITPANNTEFIETAFSSTISLDHDQSISAHFYRDVADDDADDTGEIRFFEVQYTADKLGETDPH